MAQFKYGTIYREALRAPKLEMCGLMGVTKKENILLYYSMEQLNASVPNFVHPCPYTVTFIHALRTLDIDDVDCLII
jgi:hypothetical protein